MSVSTRHAFWYVGLAGRWRVRAAVYGNRSRLKSGVGKPAMRKRGEMVERRFAHILDRGSMRRAWLRGRQNVHKRYLIQVAGFNLGALMRAMFSDTCSDKGRPGRPRAPELRFCSWFNPIRRWRSPSSRPSTAKGQCLSSRLTLLNQKAPSSQAVRPPFHECCNSQAVGYAARACMI